MVALIGCVFFFQRLTSDYREINGTATPAPKIRNQSNAQKRKQDEKQIVAAKTNVLVVTNKFHWSQIESGDYRQYIENLRSVGCPEATIRDIVITDIMRLYAARRGQFYHNGREFKFWETDEKRKLKAKQLEEREKQLAQIDKEIPSVLRELLGINYEREINKYFVDTNEDERRLNFISEEKRARLIALRDEIEGQREKITGGAGEAGLADADRQSLWEIEQKRLDELAKILTPAELQEFELRTSETADKLRADLVGFNPNETEFREIYRLQKQLDDKYALTDANDPNIVQKKAADEAQLQAELRKALGDFRYAEFERAKDPEFRNASLFSEIYELPPSTAQSIFDIQQIALREKQALLARNDLAGETREIALKAIQTETEKSLMQILGTKLLGTYSQSSGRWLQQLGTSK